MAEGPRLLRSGDRGEDVAELQRSLTRVGHRLDDDGSFGRRTKAAVQSFQKVAGLDADGVVGPATRAALLAHETMAIAEQGPHGQVRRTPSVQAAAELPDPISSVALARWLWEGHSDYPARERALQVLDDFRPAQQPQMGRDWVDAVERRLDRAALEEIEVPADRVLHGKLLLYGLAAVEEQLRGVLEDSGLLQELRAAITPDPETLFLHSAGASEEQLQAGETPPPPPPPSPDAKLIADAPATVDLLDREGFANALSRLLRHQRRREGFGQGPILVQLFGAWGSGKTSLAGFVRRALEQPDEVFGPQQTDRWLFVTFDAWQHQRTAPPWWWLMDRVYRQARSKRPQAEGGLPARRRRAVWWWRWGTVALAVVLAAAFVAAGVLLRDVILDRVDEAQAAITAVVGLATAIGGAYVLVRGSRAALLVGSPRAATALLRSGGDPYRRVHDRYCSLIERIDRPVLVFIDNLDRCQPAYLVELLEGIQTIFADVPVTYLVAADREWVAHSFEQQYADFTGVMGRPGRPLGYLFLEKTFAVSAPLPRPSLQAQERYWEAVLRDGSVAPEPVTPAARQQAQAAMAGSSVAEALGAVRRLAPEDRSAEARALREAAATKVVDATVEGSQDHELRPYLSFMDANPRSLKRLRNSVSIARAGRLTSGDPVAGAADLDGLIRWTILMLRWPSLAVAVTEHPELLTALAEADGIPDELATVAGDPALRRLLTEPVGGRPPGLAPWVVSTYGTGSPAP